MEKNKNAESDDILLRRLSAGAARIELALTVLETAVLPLNHAPMFTNEL